MFATITTNIIQKEELRKDMFWISVGLIGLCACIYVYCITTTVRNIVEKKNLLAEASMAGETISAKEFQLIGMENQITPAYAASLGFSDPANKTFISPASVSFVSDPHVENGNI